MNNLLKKLLLTTSLLYAVQVASGQTTANPDSALQTILDGLHGSRLSLQQATEHALTNATSVRSAEAAYNAAEGTVRRESGAFDPAIFLSLNHSDDQQPTSSAFAGAPVLATQQTLSRGGLRLNTAIGTQLELSVNTSRLTTNSALATLNPEYDATGLLTLRQPLLAGFAASARKGLSSAEEQLDAGKARYDQAVLAVKAEVERTYWDLYKAERDYAVQRLTCDRGREFLKETQLRAETGLVGSNQVASAKTFLAEQELQLFDREESLGHQSDVLAALIGVQPTDSTMRFLPVDAPPSDFKPEPIETLVARAVKNNLDLQAAQKDVNAVQTLADAAQWEALPQVDLIGSVGGNGLLGNAQLVSIPGFPTFTGPGGSYGDALNQAIKRDYPTWSVGVELTIPIGLRSGLGEKDRLDAQVVSAQQRSVDFSRQLEEQVRAAYREVANGKGRLQAAKDGVDAAQEQVRIGLIEFRTGRVTAFELVRLGEDFATAQQRYSDALVRTAKAAATLKQLTSEESISTNTR